VFNGRGRTAGEAGEYRLATMQSRIARLKGELGGRGLELEEGFEEGGGYVEMPSRCTKYHDASVSKRARGDKERDTERGRMGRRLVY